MAGLFRRLYDGFAKRGLSVGAVFQSWFHRSSGVLMEDSDLVTRPMEQLATFAKVARAITRNVAQVPFQVGQWRKEQSRAALRRFWKDGYGRGYRIIRPVEAAKRQAQNEVWEEAVDHKLSRLFWAPSQFLSRYELWEGVSMWLIHEGEAIIHWYDRNDLRDIPTGMELLQPWHVKGDPEDGQPERWMVTVKNGAKVPMEFVECSHIKYYNPYNPFRGLSYRDACSMDIHAIWDSKRFNRAIIKNGGWPGGILHSKTPLSEAQREQLRHHFEEKYQGPTKANRVIPVSGAEIEFKQIQYNHQRMQFLELIQKSEEDIRGVYKVPEAEISQYENTSYASSEVGKASFWEATILPDLRLIEDGLWQSLFRHVEGGKYEGRFDISQIPALREQLGPKLTNAKMLFDMGYPINVINEQLGLGLPRLSYGDVGYKPMTLVPWDTEILPGSGPQDQKSMVRAFEPNDVAAHDAYWRRWIKKVQEPSENRMQSKVSRWLMTIRADVLSKLAEVAKNNAKSYGRAWEDVPLISQDDAEYIIANRKAWAEELGAMMKPLYEQVMDVALDERFQELGSEVVVTLKDPAIKEFLSMKTIRLQEGPAASITREVRKILVKGIEDNLTAGQIAGNLKDLFNGAKDRALRVARTETLQAAGWAQHEADVRSGVVEKHMWLTAMDEVVRESHLTHQSLGYVPLDYEYAPGLLYPGGPGSTGDEVINCRCTDVPLLEGETVEMALRRALACARD